VGGGPNHRRPNNCLSRADIAYCVLDDWSLEFIQGFGGASAHDLGAIVPPMMPTGCNRQWLYKRLYFSGSPVPVDAVGAGCEDLNSHPCDLGNDFGIKRHVQSSLLEQVAFDGAQAPRITQPSPYDVTEDLVSGPIQGGDSGGPLNIRMPDGTYRVVGIANAIDQEFNFDGMLNHRNVVYYAPLPLYLRWIESSLRAAWDLHNTR